MPCTLKRAKGSASAVVFRCDATAMVSKRGWAFVGEDGRVGVVIQIDGVEIGCEGNCGLGSARGKRSRGCDQSERWFVRNWETASIDPINQPGLHQPQDRDCRCWWKCKRRRRRANSQSDKAARCKR